MMVFLLGSIGCSEKGTDEAKAPVLEKVKPFTAYIYQGTNAFKEPNEQTPVLGLSEGRVVTVFEKQGDWSKVVYYTYDKPGNNIGWVHDNTYTNEGKFMTLIEGQIKNSELLYDNLPPKGKKIKGKVDKNSPVFITAKTKNGWVQGILPGGVNVFLEDKNISYVGPALK